MTELDLGNLRWELGQILERYQVHMHLKASSPGAPRRYAVFGGGSQHCEPTTHALAQLHRRSLVVDEIVDTLVRTGAIERPVGQPEQAS
jgi:hypothetical protein